MNVKVQKAAMSGIVCGNKRFGICGGFGYNSGHHRGVAQFGSAHDWGS